MSEVQSLERRAQTYRDYPTELKAAVIQAIEQNGGNVFATSKLFNLPRDTVNYWWRNSQRFVEIKHASSSNLADKLENIAHSTADSLSTHDLSVVTYADKARALGVVVDKMQLLRGNPTGININIDASKLLLQKRIDRIVEKTQAEPIEVERELQEALSDQSDDDYVEELDANRHPEAWPSGNLLRS